MKLEKYVTKEEMKEVMEESLPPADVNDRRLVISSCFNNTLQTEDEEGNIETVYGNFLTIYFRERPSISKWGITLDLPDVEDIDFDKYSNIYERMLMNGINAVLNAWWKNHKESLPKTIEKMIEEGRLKIKGYELNE